MTEAAPEKLELKQQIFQHLDAICAPDTILATNTSVIPVTDIGALTRHRQRVLGTHYWNPPYAVRLVEVVQTAHTAPEAIERTMGLMTSIGQLPVHVKRDVPGFIGNRLQFAMLREAWALWASGAASADAIDAVVRNSFGRRVAITGPLESADVGGLATMYHFGRSLMPDLDRAPEPAEAVARLVAEGANGLSTKRGVHDWTKRDGDKLLAARMAELFRWLKHDRERSR